MKDHPKAEVTLDANSYVNLYVRIRDFIFLNERQINRVDHHHFFFRYWKKCKNCDVFANFNIVFLQMWKVYLFASCDL